MVRFYYYIQDLIIFNNFYRISVLKFFSGKSGQGSMKFNYLFFNSIGYI